MRSFIIIICIGFLLALLYFNNIQSNREKISQIELSSSVLSVKLSGVPIDNVVFNEGHLSFDLLSETKAKVWIMRANTFLRNGDLFVDDTKQGWNRISEDDPRDFRWLSEDRNRDLIYTYRDDKVIGFIVYRNTRSGQAWVVNNNNDGVLINFSDLHSVNEIELVLKGITFSCSQIDLNRNW